MHYLRAEYVVDIYNLAQRISRDINKIVGTKTTDYLVSTELEKRLDMMEICQSRRKIYDPDSHQQTFDYVSNEKLCKSAHVPDSI